MKKLNLLLLFIVLLSFNVFSQIKTYTYEKYGIINKYTGKSVLTVNEKLILRKTGELKFLIQVFDPNLKEKPVFTFSVEYKGYSDLNKNHVYLGDCVQEGIQVENCMILSPNKLDVFLKGAGRSKEDDAFDKELSFLAIMVNKDKDYYHFFPIKNENVVTSNSKFDSNKISDKEKREVLEIPHLNKEKEQEQKKVNNIEEIKKILSELNIEEKISQIKIEIEEHYKSILKDKMINISAKDMVGLRNLSKTLSLTGEFMLYVNQNKDIEIIKKITNCVDDDHSFSISDDKSNFFNREALSLKDKCTDEYKINGHTYYKLNNDIFTDDYKIDKKITLEIRILRVNFKKGKFKYYTNGDRVPEIVENWCASNITTNGSYFINTIIIDGELTCNILNLDYKTRVYLSGYLKQVY